MAVLRRLESKTQKRLQFVRERQLCIQVDALPLQINPLHSNSSYLLTYQHPQLADRTPLLASTLCACKQNLPTCGLRGPEPLNSSPPLTEVESYKSIEYFRVKRNPISSRRIPAPSKSAHLPTVVIAPCKDLSLCSECQRKVIAARHCLHPLVRQPRDLLGLVQVAANVPVVAVRREPRVE